MNAGMQEEFSLLGILIILALRDHWSLESSLNPFGHVPAQSFLQGGKEARGYCWPMETGDLRLQARGFKWDVSGGVWWLEATCSWIVCLVIPGWTLKAGARVFTLQVGGLGLQALCLRVVLEAEVCA